MIWEKHTCQRLFYIVIDKREHISVFSLPHINSTSFGGLTPLHHPIYMQLNRKETAAAVPVVEVLAEVVEAVVVAHVVDMGVEVVETVLMEY